jgi:hypothetical protein
MGGQYIMAKAVLWVISLVIYMAMYQNYKHHIENSRWALIALIGIIAFIAIIELIEKVKKV